MHAVALQVVTEGSGRVEQIARTFGVDWTHLIAQLISFGIVCAILYALAYKPILRMLDARRRQIADGLANAEQIRRELQEIEVRRRAVLEKADAEGRALIEDARRAAARVEAEQAHKTAAAAAEILARAREAAERDHVRMLAELKREVGQLVVRTAAAVTGRILTPEDHRRLLEDTARTLGSSSM
jgi:F-type H+-transporting ATPase subunit b